MQPFTTTGFTNACFLLFIRTFLMVEAFHMLYKPPDMHSHNIGLALIGVCFDAVGLLLFSQHARYRPVNSAAVGLPSASLSGRGGGRDANLHGVFLHILSDTMTNAGFIVATVAFQWRSWSSAHGVVALTLACVMMHLSYPLARDTGNILLQTIDAEQRAGIDKCVRETSFYDGVLQCRAGHW
jgi:Co/Zn/Cd efflux system component